MQGDKILICIAIGGLIDYSIKFTNAKNFIELCLDYIYSEVIQKIPNLS